MERLLAQEILRPLRYCVVGGGTLITYLVFSLLLARSADLSPSIAAAAAAVIASAINYVGHATFTFRGNRSLGYSIARYLVLVAGNSVLAGIVVGSLHRLGLTLVLANAFALVLVTIAGYMIMAKWVMREDPN